MLSAVPGEAKAVWGLQTPGPEAPLGVPCVGGVARSLATPGGTGWGSATQVPLFSLPAQGA